MKKKKTIVPMTESDPMHSVHYYDGNWWFWNETWADRIGPYVSRDTATKALRTYVKEELGE